VILNIIPSNWAYNVRIKYIHVMELNVSMFM